jgi:hypothetical protein
LELSTSKRISPRPYRKPAEPPHLDDAARGRRVGKAIDPGEAHVVGATVDAVDHGVGLAGQFVMQPGGDEAPDDGRGCRVGVNHVVGDATILTTSGPGAWS